MVEMVQYYPMVGIKSWLSGIWLVSMLTTHVNGRVETVCCNHSSLASLKGRPRIKKNVRTSLLTILQNSYSVLDVVHPRCVGVTLGA
jgi:hypothetical protein